MKKLLFAGAAVVLASSAAVAQVPHWGGQAQPRDGVQTRTEAVQWVQRMFAHADLDRDGFLTQQEAQQARGAKRAQRAQRGGRNADPARQAQRADRAFARLDLNRDGVISRQEFAQRQAMRAERRQGGQRGPRMGMAGRGGGALGGRMFALADLNRDNRLSLQEATGAALQRFNRVDLNRDGQVTRDERQRARQQWGSQRRG